MVQEFTKGGPALDILKFDKIPENDIKSSHNGPWRITFDTNPDDCNMSCVMCEEHSEFSPLRKERIIEKRPHRRMDFSIISNTVIDMVKQGLVEIIPSTMGEPLLYDNFVKFIELCKNNNIKLNLTTNGTWPKLGPMKWAELICPVTSDVKISWNGALKKTQETIMKGSEFEKRLKDLKKFIAVRDKIAENFSERCRITLQCTFLETNSDELPGLIKMAAEIGIDRVKGHQLCVNFPEIANLDMRRSQGSIEKWNKVVDRCYLAARAGSKRYGKPIILENFNKLSEDVVGMMPEDWVCPFLGKEAWVNYRGEFNPCCAPDAERRKLGYFGNVMDEGGISAIWNGTKYRNLVATYKSNDICKKCNMRKPPERKINLNL